MKKCIYKVIEFKSTGISGGLVDTNFMESKLNQLGESGWEDVTGYTTTKGHGATRKVVYTLKKQPTDDISN